MNNPGSLGTFGAILSPSFRPRFFWRFYDLRFRQYYTSSLALHGDRSVSWWSTLKLRLGGALALICACSSGHAQPVWDYTDIGLPSLVQQQAADTDWVPVVLMNRSQSGPTQAADGVLLGFLQVQSPPEQWSAPSYRRVQVQGKVPVIDRLSLKGMLAGSEFRPCLGLITHNDLAPLRPDLCESFGWSTAGNSSHGMAVGAQLDLAKGWIGVSLQHSEGRDLDLVGPAFSSSPLPHSFDFASPTQALLHSPIARHNRTLGLDLQAMLELDPESRIGIGLALARAQLHGVTGVAPTTLDQGALTFTLEQGNLGAALGTRVVDLPGLSDFLPWAGLDLGVSWRLPWQGVISVGAQNLLRYGNPPPKGLDPTLDEGAESFERIPYVRYHQDL